MTSQGLRKMAAKILTYVPRYVTKTNDLALHRWRQMRDGGACDCAVPIGPTPTLIWACLQTVGKIIITPPVKGAEYCDQPVCLYVCLSVCLCASISLEPLDRSAGNFVCRSPVVVARSSSGGVALRYILPVLWMTSRLSVTPARVSSSLLSIVDQLRACATGAESDVFEYLL